MRLLDKVKLLSEIRDDDTALAIYKKIISAEEIDGPIKWNIATDETLPKKEGRTYLCCWEEVEENNSNKHVTLRKGFAVYDRATDFVRMTYPGRIFADGSAFMIPAKTGSTILTAIKVLYWIDIPDAPCEEA